MQWARIKGTSRFPLYCGLTLSCNTTLHFINIIKVIHTKAPEGYCFIFFLKLNLIRFMSLVKFSWTKDLKGNIFEVILKIHQNQAFLRNWLRPKLVLQISDYGHTRVFVLFFVMRSRFLKQIKEFWAVCCVPVIYLPLTTCANRERASGEKKNESSPLALYIVGSNWDRIWAILWENFSWMRCFFSPIITTKVDTCSCPLYLSI